jgi:hypothetical protein
MVEMDGRQLVMIMIVQRPICVFWNHQVQCAIIANVARQNAIKPSQGLRIAPLETTLVEGECKP